MKLKLAYFVAIMIPNKRSVGSVLQLPYKKRSPRYHFLGNPKSGIVLHLVTLQPKNVPSLLLLHLRTLMGPFWIRNPNIAAIEAHLGHEN